jgi:hypothetical protein
MAYIGKKPADIIATSVDTTTGTFSGDLTVDTTTLYVDSANNRVGVGTVSPAKPLHIFNSGTSYVQISGNSRDLFLGQDAIGGAVFSTGAVPLYFSTDSTERMRIDSSGNLLVGTTSSSGSGDGIVLGANDQVIATRNGAAPLWLNRRSNDGDIVLFNRDGVTVGSIGARSNSIYIGLGDTGISFTSNDDAVYPVSPSGLVARDAAIDLGVDTVRFKDLYLSGTATMGGLTVDATSNDVIITGPAQTGVASSVVELKTGGTVGNRSGYAITNSNGGSLIGMTGEVVGTGAYPSNTGKGYLWNSDSGIVYRSLGFEKNLLQFYIAGSEKMRIDNSGNLLVGKTVADNTTTGVRIQTDGFASFARDSNFPLLLNRKTSDGTILDLRKDGTTVGSVGVASGAAYFAGNTRGIRIVNQVLHPTGTTGVVSDADVDLGYTTGRFKNLYLSGGVLLGGTVAANLLDDYEEGTFTAQLSTDTTYFGDGAQLGVYTKIGNICFFEIKYQRTGTVNTGVNARFGLPFTSANNSVQATGSRGSVENIDTAMVGIGGTVASNSAILYLNEMNTATTGFNVNGNDLGTNFQIQIQGFYKTA